MTYPFDQEQTDVIRQEFRFLINMRGTSQLEAIEQEISSYLETLNQEVVLQLISKQAIAPNSTLETELNSLLSSANKLNNILLTISPPLKILLVNAFKSIEQIKPNLAALIDNSTNLQVHLKTQGNSKLRDDLIDILLQTFERASGHCYAALGDSESEEKLKTSLYNIAEVSFTAAKDSVDRAGVRKRMREHIESHILAKQKSK